LGIAPPDDVPAVVCADAGLGSPICNRTQKSSTSSVFARFFGALPPDMRAMIVATQPKRQRGVAIAHDAIAVRGLMRECRKSWEGAPKHASLLRDFAMVQGAVFRLARLLLTALHS
jgi:hypothetical protein